MSLADDQSSSAPTVFVNGNIVTLDHQSTVAEAMTVSGATILAVGQEAQLRRRGSGGEIVDLHGATVVPGFVDAHAHMDREGLKLLPHSLEGAHTLEDLLGRVAEAVASTPAGEWVVMMPPGDYPEYGGSPERLADGRYPTRADLDGVAPDHPVYIRAPWYYWAGENPMVSVANSAALRLAGVTADTAAPHTGLEMGRDPDGRLDGTFREYGRIGTVEYTLMDVVPKFSHADRVHALRESMRRYNAAGTTSVYEGHGVAPAVLAAYDELHGHGELTVRSRLVISPTWDAYRNLSPADAMAAVAKGIADRGAGDDMLGVEGIHVEVGTSVQEDLRKGACSNPGWAGFSVDSTAPTDWATLEDLLRQAAHANLRVNAITHDALLLDDYLDVIELVDRAEGIRHRRWVLQHLSFVTDRQLQRLAGLGIETTIVPGTTLWKHGLGRTHELAPDLAETYLPLRRFLNAGVPFAFATDNVPIEPLTSVWAAVTREDLETGRCVGPGQTLSVQEALRAFTVAGARLTGEENVKGTLQAGKLADFAVLSANPLDVPARELTEIEVLATVVGGRTVHGDLGSGT